MENGPLRKYTWVMFGCNGRSMTTVLVATAGSAAKKSEWIVQLIAVLEDGGNHVRTRVKLMQSTRVTQVWPVWSDTISP